MRQHYEPIRELLNLVRARWKRLSIFHAVVRAALGASGVLGVALITTHAAHWTGRSPIVLAAAGALVLGLGVLAIIRGLAPLRHVPSDARLARFIEERTPSLDDRLVSAVDLVQSERYPSSPAIAEPMLADAARRARAVELDEVVSSQSLRRAGFQAVAAGLIFLALALVAREPAQQALDAASLALFPSRVTLEVRPGNARIKAGTPLAIEARLVGNRAPIVAEFQIGEGDHWRTSEMTTAPDGTFHLAFESVTSGFTYRVVAGTVVSSTYAVTVAHAPRVTRIDVDYTYPAALRLKPRTEEDSGDIYAPAGTDIRLRIHTDRPAANGQLALGDGNTIALAAQEPTLLAATLKVVDDNSYRVALSDRDGFTDPGDTEYFIRTLEDRPPEVHIVKPASDRAVTRLEEVDIEAQADDDYGIDRLDLVYSVGGNRETIVPLDVPRHATTVSARRTVYLEDLNVQPGDFVSYYVRARDITRGGKRSNEARSDIFFLEVRSFEREFSLAQNQRGAGAGAGGAVDDLVDAQKQVVVATWKLDRRAETAKGSQSEQDLHSVARAEANLKSRVEQTSSTFRQSSMRDPRRPPGRGGEPGAPKAGQTLPEEDAMAKAADAMGKAVDSLDALKTSDALPPEMQALTLLLKAQADVKKQEVPAQQSGGKGPVNNNRNYDISTLFDKELQRAQQTNYEAPKSNEPSEDPNANTLDKIKDLAKRQDELVKQQQQLAGEREKMSQEELKRELEKLTREQSELRQRAEDLAQQMSGQQPPQQGQQPPQQGQQSSQQGQQQSPQQGQQSSQQGQQQSPQQGQQSQSSQQSQSAGGSGGGESGKRMRDVSEEMRNAASDLRRQDPGQASARGSRALEKLRELERQLQTSRPDDRRRALGEMQLEARQLADAQRQVASELGKIDRGDAGKDATRRLAGEEERLADRARRLQDSLKQQAAGAVADKDKKDKGASKETGAQAAAEAATDLERQRLAERMQKSAEDMRAAAGQDGKDNAAGKPAQDSAGTPTPGLAPEKDPQAQASAQQDIARTLDKVADKLGSASGARDGESRKLSEELTKAQELRDRINSLSDELAQLGKQDGKNAGQSNPSTQKTPGESGKTGEGQQGDKGGKGSADLARLRDEYTRQLEQTRELIDQLRREDPNFAHGGGAGFTFEGRGMTLSAPGTEGFKQDFAKWEELRRQATQALDNIESALSKQLQAKESRDRLAAGVDDKAPPEYQQQVDSYFKALATKKKP